MTANDYGQAPVPKKTNVGMWVAIGCSVAFLAFLGFLGFIVVVVFGSMRSSTPYKEAVATAQKDARVIAALGSPVEPGFFFTGSINTQNDSGTASFSIPISGPKGEGKLHVEGVKTRGKWTYREMMVVTQGTEINLLEESPGTVAPAV